ncbi:non-ribosomal peptide synthetase [Pseudozobellia thermophila]|uniref:Amino acid adenylation domain-containing protein n=1 Tax=Pseudozobellia thermophila TaxID=192903 RepID=A0A1M6IT97_9FLAO|nr:non-ribosomal peptide synthetase [Pseudozobellia thermophila]SHJ37693.1 amino acid adenylation domain-containing protein [Pseudozobellia thermophila]
MEDKNTNGSLLSRWKNKDKALRQSIPKAPEGVAIPLSKGQQRIWFLQQLYPDNPFYNYSEALHFKGKLNSVHFKASLAKVFGDADILRSYYPMVEGRPVMKISDDLPQIKEIDLSGLPEELAAKKLEVLMEEQSRTAFDLEVPEMVRAALIDLGKDRYVLFLTMHHMVIDEWSIGILKRQLATHYNNLVDGSVLPETSPPLQYQDYAFWERQQEVRPEGLAYWKGVLFGDIPVLDLPTDFPRPVRPQFRGRQETRTLSADTSSKVLDQAKRLEATPFVFLLSVYYILLHRYTGQGDILIGTPISKRNTRELENTLGFFIDTIVLRNPIDPSSTVKELVGQVKRNTLEAFSHKNVPFDVLVRQMKVDRSLAINPFFQVMFLYHPQEEVPSFGDEVRLEEETEFDSKVAKFDLTLSIKEVKGQLALTFEYDTDLFTLATVERMLAHFELLLLGTLHSDEAPIIDLPMLTAAEKIFFFEKPTEESTPFSAYTAIHQIIGDLAGRFPLNKAVTFENASLTYEMLDSRADKLAFEILDRTAGRNEIVGLCAHRSVEMIVGLLAILKAGCAYLPIDPHYPVERINFMLSDAGCTQILAHGSLGSLFEGRKNIIHLDGPVHFDVDKGMKLPEVDEDGLAYVIYTSGSSGKPKGVAITHKNIISSTAGRLKFYPKPPEAFLLMSSISFDSAMAGIFWTLCTGGNLVIAENRIEQDILQVENSIADQKITHTLMLPSLYHLLLKHATPERIAGLQTVIVAGEACAPAVCRTHFQVLPHTALYNEYGPTEATVWCTAHKVEPGDSGNTVPIGKAVAGAKIYVLGPKMRLVPYGAIGELFIGGPGLALGYINRPALTDNVFLDSPFSYGLPTKLYKTGDLGRFQSDGALVYMGRVDQQIKLRGFRVELEEVGKALMDVKGVGEAVALVENQGGVEADIGGITAYNTKDVAQLLTRLRALLSDEELDGLLASLEKSWSESNGHGPYEKLPIDRPEGHGVEGRVGRLSEEGRSLLLLRAERMGAEKSGATKSPTTGRLLAFITADEEVDMERLKRSLRKTLPDYMLPSRIIEVESLPLLPNGKVDKKRLLAMVPSKGRPEEENPLREEPGPSDAEAGLLAIWKEVLGLPEIGLRDNFFDIGGDSILSIQVIAMARAAGMPIRPSQLFEHQTIAELAHSVVLEKNRAGKAEGNNGFKHLVAIRPTGSKPPLFCLHSGGTHFFFYNLFAKHLQADRPVYALQASPHEGNLVIHDSVAAMARDFVAEIRKVSPNGPYHFISYCYNTAVGLEMVRLLEKESVPVNLIIADTMADYLSLFAPSRTPQRAAAFLDRFKKAPLRTTLRLIGSKLLRPLRQKLKRVAVSPSERKIQVLHNNHIKIYRAYQWQRIHGGVQLLLTSKKNTEFNEMLIASWERLTGKSVELEPIQGHHNSLFLEGDVAVTAGAVDKLMSRFEGMTANSRISPSNEVA